MRNTINMNNRIFDKGYPGNYSGNVILLCVLFAFVLTPLAAQEKSNNLFSLSLSELLEINITGSTLTPENMKTVPSAVTIFTHDEIKRMGFDSLDELMNLVPGFQSYRSSSSSLVKAFSSRGRRISDSSSEVLILVDGQRLEDPASSGSAFMVPKFPLMNIERVEFIRGPGAAIYGSNAMMGVISIFTRVDANEIALGYGSFSRRQGHFLGSQKMGDSVIDYFGHYEVDDGEDYHVQSTFGPGQINTDDPRELAELNIKFRWKKTSINYQHYQTEVDNFYQLGSLSNGFNHRRTQLDAVSLKQEFDWSNVESWLWLSYSNTSLSVATQGTAPGDLLLFSNPASSDALFVSASFDDVNETRVQWHNDLNFGGQSSFQFGAEVRRIDSPETIAKNNFDLAALANGSIPITYYGGDMLATTPVQAKSTRNIVGLYSQYQHDVTKGTRMTLGLRYDNYSNIGSEVSPRFALVQQLNKQHAIKLLYGEAFRSPSENELNLLNNIGILGNPDLKPETVQSLDLIWVAQWQNTGFSLGYFENHFQNSIVQVDPGFGPLQYQNMDQDPIRGYEMELSHEFNKNWLVRSTYTYINQKPDLSFREAEKLASLLLNYQKGQWNASLIATYQGERESPVGGSTDNRITLDDYWQYFGKLCYKFDSQWQAYIQAKNMLDETYVTPATTTNLTEGVQNRGREVMAGVIWKY